MWLDFYKFCGVIDCYMRSRQQSLLKREILYRTYTLKSYFYLNETCIFHSCENNNVQLELQSWKCGFSWWGMSFCAEETDEKDKWNVATRSSSSLEKLGIFPSGQVIRNYLAIDLKSDAIIDEVTLYFLESSKWMFLNSSICPADLSSWYYVWNWMGICIQCRQWL